MNAAAKRHWADIRSGDVEAVGLRINCGVPVRGTEQAEDCFTFSDRCSAYFDVFECGTSSALDGGIVPQELLDCVGRERGIVAQQLQLIRIAVKRKQSIPDEVHGRFVPR